MKKIMASVLAAAMIIGAGTATAFTGADTVITANAATQGKYESLTYYNYEDHIEIYSFDQSVTTLEIPAEIEGLPVTVIGERAFENATSLESVVVPENVTTLSSNCFNKCTSLKSISLPSTLKTIKNLAFYNCISLESIEIPKRTTTLEHNVFNGCANLRTVIINGVPELRDWTFQKCKIDKLYLAKSVTVIDPDAFLDATVKEVYYAGSPEQWEIINANGRKIFENSTIHFEAENYESPLTPDVNRDSAIDASDASLILAYYAYVMTGGTGTIEEYIASQNS